MSISSLLEVCLTCLHTDENYRRYFVPSGMPTMKWDLFIMRKLIAHNLASENGYIIKNCYD